LISSSEHILEVVSGYELLPTGGTSDGNFLSTPRHFERSKALHDKMQLLEINIPEELEGIRHSHTHSEIAFANGTIEAGGKFLQYQITGRMAVSVVDALEIVQVQQHHCQGMPFAGERATFRGEALLGKPTVV